MTRDIIGYTIMGIFLIAIYFLCFNLAETGYGYPGYRGYTNHRAYYIGYGYFGNYDVYRSPSNRETSSGGSRFSRKGINGGK